MAQTYKCPGCELRFAIRAELEDHARTSHARPVRDDVPPPVALPSGVVTVPLDPAHPAGATLEVAAAVARQAGMAVELVAAPAAGLPTAPYLTARSHELVAMEVPALHWRELPHGPAADAVVDHIAATGPDLVCLASPRPRPRRRGHRRKRQRTGASPVLGPRPPRRAPCPGRPRRRARHRLRRRVHGRRASCRGGRRPRPAAGCRHRGPRGGRTPRPRPGHRRGALPPRPGRTARRSRRPAGHASTLAGPLTQSCATPVPVPARSSSSAPPPAGLPGLGARRRGPRGRAPRPLPGPRGRIRRGRAPRPPRRPPDHAVTRAAAGNAGADGARDQRSHPISVQAWVTSAPRARRARDGPGGAVRPAPGTSAGTPRAPRRSRSGSRAPRRRR